MDLDLGGRFLDAPLSGTLRNPFGLTASGNRTPLGAPAFSARAGILALLGTNGPSTASRGCSVLVALRFGQGSMPFGLLGSLAWSMGLGWLVEHDGGVSPNSSPLADGHGDPKNPIFERLNWTFGLSER